MRAVDRNELDFTEGFAVHGIKQQIILKEGESIIWSRDKLKASQPWIDPVCARVDGIQQRAWGQQERNGEYLSPRQNVHFGEKKKQKCEPNESELLGLWTPLNCRYAFLKGRYAYSA